MRNKVKVFTCTAISVALGSIAISLSSLAKDTKARKKTMKVTLDTLNDFDKSVKELETDPFGLNKRN